MIKLIKNEMIKIFSKKSLYIILIIMFGVMIYQAKIYHTDFENDFELFYSSAQQEFANIDSTTYNGLMDLVEAHTKFDIAQMVLDKYGSDSWQAFVICQTDYMAYEMYHDYYFLPNQIKYFEGEPYEIENTIDKNIAYKSYEEINEIFEENDWRKMANMLIETYEEDIKNYEQEQLIRYDEDTERFIEHLKVDIEVLNIRLNENIPFGFDYLNEALEEYDRSKMSFYYYNKKENITHMDKVEYQKNLENFEESKYIIETRNDINNIETTRANISRTFEDIAGQQLFIIILIVLVSATIVSEEYNKGTIKQLLIRPYSRIQIILAKFVTCLIMILIFGIIIILLNTGANIIVNGAESLNVPMTMYNFNTNTLIVMNMAEYLIIQFIAKLPIFIIIFMIAFACSTLCGNTIIASIIPYFIYSASKLSYFFVIEENINILRFFITTNWDLSGMLFGRLSEFPQLTLGFSIIICVIYFIMFLFPTLICFNEFDVKNK